MRRLILSATVLAVAGLARAATLYVAQDGQAPSSPYNS
jgi:hypothetical protein